MRTPTVAALALLGFSALFAEGTLPQRALELRIEADGNTVAAYIKNVSASEVKVRPRLYGWWEFTTVLYHDGREWHEARLKEKGPKAKIGAARAVVLEPGEVLSRSTTAPVASPKSPEPAWTFKLDLSDYQLPRSVKAVRVQCNGLRSNVVNIDPPGSIQSSVARVVSVADSGMHYLLYVVEFQITRGPSKGQTLKCLIDGYGDQAKMLGRGEDWWWEFVYRKSRYKGESSFRIDYKPSEQRFHRRFGTVELVSIKPSKNDTGESSAMDADRSRR